MATAKARGTPSRARRRSSMSWAALGGYRSSGSLLQEPHHQGIHRLRDRGVAPSGGSGTSVRCFMAVASAPSATNGTVPVSIS